VTYFIIVLPLVYICHWHLHTGLEGLWLAFTAGLAYMSLGYTLIIRRIDWEASSQMDQKVELESGAVHSEMVDLDMSATQEEFDSDEGEKEIV